MLHFPSLFIFLVFLQHCYSAGFYIQQISNLMAIQCKDNWDAPVDWWYIYKPPKNSGRYMESGGNFTYLTSNKSRRFQVSRTSINHNSMLQFTLAPLYETKFKKSMAVMSYGEQPSENGDPPASIAHGILYANIFGGVWISHSIPEFPDLRRSAPFISDEDYTKGHMLMCLTLDLETVNLLASVVRHTNTKITKFTLPDSLSLRLPEWAHSVSVAKFNEKNATKTKFVTFSTKSKTLGGRVLARGPADPRCLYTTFAKVQGLVIDVYNRDSRKPEPICETEYSVRYINSISLKFPDAQVSYINKENDRMSFGVSTGALWQRGSRNFGKFWSCTGLYDPQGDLAKAGLITCVEDFDIWFSFDNLKTKEPECNQQIKYSL